MGKLKKLSAANRIETKIKYFQIVSIHFGGECFWRIGNAFWLATIMMWGKVIEEWESAGWDLHTYACAGNAVVALGTNHYLLFKKGQ